MTKPRMGGKTVCEETQLDEDGRGSSMVCRGWDSWEEASETRKMVLRATPEGGCLVVGEEAVKSERS